MCKGAIGGGGSCVQGLSDLRRNSPLVWQLGDSMLQHQGISPVWGI